MKLLVAWLSLVPRMKLLIIRVLLSLWEMMRLVVMEKSSLKIETVVVNNSICFCFCKSQVSTVYMEVWKMYCEG